MRKFSVALLSLALTLSMSTNSSYAASQTVVETKPLQGNVKPAPHLAPTPSPTATPLAKPRFTISTRKAVLSTSMSTTVATATSTGGAIRSFSVSPALPRGLRLNTSTGEISGKPRFWQKAKSYRLTARNASGSYSQTISVQVIRIPILKAGALELGLNLRIKATGLKNTGGAATEYSISPELPQGLTLNSTTGKISGKPALAQPKRSYLLSATNISGTSTKKITIEIVSKPSVKLSKTNFLVSPNAIFSSYTIKNTGGRVYSYSISPALPSGLKLSPKTGKISGKATSAHAKTKYTVTAKNPGGSFKTTLTLEISAAPSFKVGFYGFYPDAWLGKGATIDSPWLISEGGLISNVTITPALPEGITFDPKTFKLSGTASSSMPKTNYTLTATNIAGTMSKPFSIEISDAPSVSMTPKNPIAYSANSNTEKLAVGSPVSGFTVSNVGDRIAAWSVFPELPHGLSLDQSTGEVTGTPDSYIESNELYTFTARNPGGTSNFAYRIQIVLPPVFAISSTSEELAIGSSLVGFNLYSVGGIVDSFSISPTLPAWLSFDTATGLLSGIADAVQALITFTITATNEAGTSSKDFSLEVFEAPQFTLTSSSEEAVNGSEVSGYLINSTGGRITEYSVSPELPTGLTLDTQTGLISGAPTSDQSPVVYTITGTNVAGSDSHTFSLGVFSSPLLSLSPSSESAIVGQPITSYTLALDASYGTPTGFSISPSVPAGLVFDSTNGSLSGTPTAAQLNVEYTVSASNVAGTSSQTFSLEVFSAPAFTLSKSSENAVNNVAISGYTINTSGGRVTEYSVSPELPTGLSLDTTTGLISGSVAIDQAPTTYTITGTNVAGSDSHTFALGVYSTPSFTMSSETILGSRGSTLVGYTLTQSGGTVTSYSVSPSLPAGVSLDSSTGLISGLPTNPQAITTYTLTATNVAGSYPKTFSIEILNPPVITLSSQSSAAFKDETAISVTTTNTGGTATSFAIDPALPAGLTFNTLTGAITGTPTVLQALTEHTITASNLGGTSSKKFTLSVKLSCAAGGDCSLGDIAPGGGKVVYVNQAGFACGVDLTSTCHYMEAAPQTWSGGLADPGESAYGTRMAVAGRTVLTLDTQTYTIGYGEYNTDLLVSAVGTYSTNPCAANHAASYTSNYKGVSLDDWYLPNRTEMETVKNAGLTGIWALTGGRYWISTQQAGYMTEGGEANYLWSVGASLSSRALPATTPAYTRAVRTF
jgi:hypothetical protein